jgi:hypothetical protein
VHVAGAAWCAVMRIIARVGDLVQRTGDGRTDRVLGGQGIERSGGIMCGLHSAHGDDERGFLGSTSKPRSTVCQWFGLKTTKTVFSDLASKPATTVFSGLASKPVATISLGLASKLVVGFLVEPENQGHGGFLGLGLKTGSYGLVIWALKSLRRFLGLGLKTKQAMVCQLCHKTNERGMAWDTRQDLVACFVWKQVELGFSSLPQN